MCSRPYLSRKYLPCPQPRHFASAEHWGGERKAEVYEQNLLPLFYAIATRQCQVGHLHGPDMFMANMFAQQCQSPRDIQVFIHRAAECKIKSLCRFLSLHPQQHGVQHVTSA